MLHHVSLMPTTEYQQKIEEEFRSWSLVKIIFTLKFRDLQFSTDVQGPFSSTNKKKVEVKKLRKFSGPGVKMPQSRFKWRIKCTQTLRKTRSSSFFLKTTLHNSFQCSVIPPRQDLTPSAWPGPGKKIEVWYLLSDLAEPKFTTLFSKY